MKPKQSGFTLVEIAIVLLIVTILLGYTVALFPRQQELKQYRALSQEMDRVMEAIIGFAQVNGRLPCPALPNSVGVEDINGNVGCNNYGGFVPVNTLGLDGRFNEDSLLLDPWGNPYRYYVTFNNDGSSDFTAPGQMRLVGLVDSEPMPDPAPPGDGYIDLDGRYMICADRGNLTDDDCLDADTTVFGRRITNGGNGTETRYGGAPFVLLSMGKNWNELVLAAFDAEGNVTNQDELSPDELENSGTTLTSTTGVPSGNSYLLKDVGSGETTFMRRPGGLADDFDDVVRWVSPNVLFSRMIQAGQLP